MWSLLASAIVGVCTTIGLMVISPELGIESKRWWVAATIICAGAIVARHVPQ